MALGKKTLQDLLSPISEQLGHDGVAETVEMPEWQVKPVRATDGLSQDALVEMFITEASKIRVTVHRCSAATLPETLSAIVAAGTPDDGEPAGVVCADNGHFASVGLYEALRDTQNVADLHVWDPALGEENVQFALKATYGITYASEGIAETGTIVQPTNPHCGRAVSLLPLVHIAVIDAATIKPTMAEVMHGLEAAYTRPSQVCFISGPSATSDIELVRVEGVHGPMYVHYVVVE